MTTIRHPRLRALRADYLRDIRSLRRIVHLPKEQLLQLLAQEREQRYKSDRERLEKRIEAGQRGSPPAVLDEQLQAWLDRYRMRRPRECSRLGLPGLATRLQREHPELLEYSPDWLRQRLAGLKEALPPSSTRGAMRQTDPA